MLALILNIDVWWWLKAIVIVGVLVGAGVLVGIWYALKDFMR